MAENCTHDCSTCGSSCSKRVIPKAPLHEGSKVKKVIAVMSGKGGVGKSLISSLMAAKMQSRGFNSAIIDADIIGASIPKSFGVQNEQIYGDDKGIMIPVKSKNGTQLLSINFMLQNETDPVALRAAMITNYLIQFWKDAIWEDVDFMFVDMPPGTGDIPLTVFQQIPVDGIIIVSTPQDLVRVIVEKSVKFARMMKVPVLGIVENMSYVKCPDCDKEIHIFGKGNVEKIALEYGIPLLAKIPIAQDISEAVDSGDVEKINSDFLDAAANFIENMPELSCN